MFPLHDKRNQALWVVMQCGWVISSWWFDKTQALISGSWTAHDAGEYDAHSFKTLRSHHPNTWCSNPENELPQHENKFAQDKIFQHRETAGGSVATVQPY